MKSNVSRSKKVSFEISILYILSSIIWICSTEWILTKLMYMNVFWISIGKGCLFVLATGFLLYKLIYKKYERY